MSMECEKEKILCIVAVSGGPDSVYLVYQALSESVPMLLAHFNHRARGKESEEDRKFVERLSRKLGIPLVIETAQKRRRAESAPVRGAIGHAEGFENKAREERYRFLRETAYQYRADKILVAHTADDQVETILMRILEGAGISGLKGIPRSTLEGIERPLLDTWRKDILSCLQKHKISFREDRSNIDTRFERNWIRHVLIPLLEKRYGKSIKKRIFTLGERFREIDAYIDGNAHNWLINNQISLAPKDKKAHISHQAIRFPRKAYAVLPSILRIRILQLLCFERIGISPNERLLGLMDRLIIAGGPSGQLNIGKGGTLRCRYEEAIFAPSRKKGPSGRAGIRSVRTGTGEAEKATGKRSVKRDEKAGKQNVEKKERKKEPPEPHLGLNGPGLYEWSVRDQGKREIGGGSPVSFSWVERRIVAPERIRKLTEGEGQAVFDAERLPIPLSIRPLRIGDRIRPFGLGVDKKVKEILIDRKVPREERWGRPVVCDVGGKIVWIPGVVRSADAPVTAGTKRMILLRANVGGDPKA